MSDSDSQESVISGPSSALQSSLRTMLRPLVKLMLSRQITYPLISQLLKGLFVEVAGESFAIPGKRLTDSRINLLTGIHRKDLKRLRELANTPESAPERSKSVSLGAQIVARWTDIEEFQDGEGRPRPLSRRTPTDGSPGFDDLVRSVNRDIRPRSILDEWLRLGVAHLDDDENVVLNRDAFIPSRGFEEKAHSLGRSLHDHIAAGAHNLMDDQPPFVERSVYYSGLTPEAVEELLELAERSGMEALHKVNRRAMELQERDDTKPEARHRMRLGIFTFRAKRGDPDYVG